MIFSLYNGLKVYGIDPHGRRQLSFTVEMLRARLCLRSVSHQTVGVPKNVRLSRKKPGSASNAVLYVGNGSTNV